MMEYYIAMLVISYARELCRLLYPDDAVKITFPLRRRAVGT